MSAQGQWQAQQSGYSGVHPGLALLLQQVRSVSASSVTTRWTWIAVPVTGLVHWMQAPVIVDTTLTGVE
jgi:hypothetical protein